MPGIKFFYGWLCCFFVSTANVKLCFFKACGNLLSVKSFVDDLVGEKVLGAGKIGKNFNS